ncbi:MAG: DUF4856 domain-containing protein [Gemmatimonadota bacterium]|nr:DUF4856 domain-containing protein [Gemmatimonadota bacterium]
MQRSARRTFMTGIALAAVGLAGCDDDLNPVGPDDPNDPNDPGSEPIAVPDAYAFDSRFVDGEISVAYPGQTVRNLLTQDLRIMIDNLATEDASPVSVQDLLDRYDYRDELDLETLTGIDGAEALEAAYSAIATDKNLSGKISDATVIGFGSPADELIRDWFQLIAENSEDPDKLGTPAVYTTDDGLHMSQMVEKLLMGAVVYYQGTGVYLTDDVLLGADNTEAEEGKPYSSMEHKWDESFGYFGAARDFKEYSDADLAGESSDFTSDSNSDGFIDFRSEYNFGWARYAGKRDSGGSDVDFTDEIFQAYLNGRTAIVNEATTQEVTAERQVVAEGWEKLVAANVVHYLNDSLEDVEELTEDEVADKSNDSYNAHWAEARSFVVALQYNPFKLVSDTELEDLAGLLGTAPTYAVPGSEAHDQLVADLNAAKDIVQDVYGFSDANMAAW